MIYSTVTGVLSCAHEPINSDIFGGQIHGHSYEVTAAFQNDAGADVRIFKTSFDAMLATLDHKLLPANLATAEAIARYFGVLNKVVEVEVRRPLERLGARWRQEGNRYRHEFTATCPNNGERIAYRLTIDAPAVIMVERIVAACAVAETFHEPLADALYAEFGGWQWLEAHHHGVDLVTVRGRA